jgi:hypothetical protein
MKAITLWQPWATLIAIEAKRFETRSWSTKHRGLIAIHAALIRHKFGQVDEPGPALLAAAGYPSLFDLPSGAIVAVATIVDSQSVAAVLPVSDQERTFGDFSEGRFAWKLGDVVKLAEPVYVRGFQGIWNLPPITEAMVREQLDQKWLAGV